MILSSPDDWSLPPLPGWLSPSAGLRLITFLFALSASLSLLVSCSSSGNAPEHDYSYQPMTAYLQPDLKDNGIAEPRVHITVPLRNLVFFREDGVISGGLEVMVVAWEGDSQVGGAIASEVIILPHWDAANSDSLLTLDVRVPLEKPVEVILEVRARSLGTSRSWTKRIICHPSRWLRQPVIFTDWIWNADSEGILNNESDSLRVELLTGQVNNAVWPSQSMGVELHLSNSQGFDLSARREVSALFSEVKIQAHPFVFPLSQIPFGRYQVLASLVGHPGFRNPTISPWYPARELLVTQINFSDDEMWENQIEWLAGHFPPKVVRSLEKLPADERAEQWAQLWSGSAAGSPGEAEHLLSILEADKLFEGPEPGAQTDQGRAWIRYGPPDHVENKGNMEGRYRRWAIWYYKDAGLSLTFLDAHGLGEYRLIETEYASD